VTGVGAAAGMSVSGVTSGTGIFSTVSAGNNGVAVNAAGNNGTAIQASAVTSSITPTAAALNVTSGAIRSSAGVVTSAGTTSNQFAGRVINDGSGHMTVNNSLVRGDGGTPGSASTIIVTFDSDDATNFTSYVTSVSKINDGNFIVNCSAPAGGYINYIVINH